MVCLLFSLAKFHIYITLEVHNANCQLGFDENMMFAVLEDGLWEWTDLKHCKAAELLVPIGSWNRPVNNEEKTLRDVGLLMRQSLRVS